MTGNKKTVRGPDPNREAKPKPKAVAKPARKNKQQRGGAVTCSAGPGASQNRTEKESAAQSTPATRCDSTDIAFSAPGQEKPLPLGQGLLCFLAPAGQGPKASIARTLRQQLQDVSTAAVVKHLFADAKNLAGYIGAFSRFFRLSVADAVRTGGLPADTREEDCALVFKGGNVLVDYFEQLLRLPGMRVHEDLASLLKRSDTDFTVAMSLRMEPYRDAINRLCVRALYRFRDWLLKEYKYTLPTERDYMAEVREYNRVANEAGYEVLCADVTARPDMLVLDTGKDLARKVLRGDSSKLRNKKGCAALVMSPASLLDQRGDWSADLDSRPGGREPSHVYASFNDTLFFELGSSTRGHFDLARLKTNVKLHLAELPRGADSKPGQGRATTCIDAPGELIDASISFQDDSAHIMTRPVDEWTFMDVYGSEAVRIPTLHYIVYSDLSGILFENTKYPWLDGKYKKRLARLLLGAVLIAALGRSFPATRAPDLNHYRATSSLVSLKALALKAEIMCLLTKMQTQASIDECGPSRKNKLFPEQQQESFSTFFPELLQHFQDVCRRAVADPDPSARKQCIAMLASANVLLGHIAAMCTSLQRMTFTANRGDQQQQQEEEPQLANQSNRRSR